jgi:hypothetical protein
MKSIKGLVNYDSLSSTNRVEDVKSYNTENDSKMIVVNK